MNASQINRKVHDTNRYFSLPLSAFYWLISASGSDPISKVSGAISIILGSRVLLRVHYRKRDEVYFRTLLWQTMDGNMALYRECFFRIVWNHSEKNYFGDAILIKVMKQGIVFFGCSGSCKPAVAVQRNLICLATGVISARNFRRFIR